MKLCFLGDSSSIHTIRVVEYFAKKGHNVSLIGFEDPKINKVTFFQLKKYFRYMDLNYLVNMPALRKYLLSIKPDVLHAHYVTSYGSMAACSGFKPVVLSCWGSDILLTPNKNLFLKLLTRFVLRNVDYLTFDSDPVRTKMRELAGKRLRAKSIIFGVEKTLLSSKKKNNGKKTVLISMRNLEPLYNIDKIIQAFPLVKTRFKHVSLIVAGKGTMLKELRELTARLKLEDSVSFVGSLPKNKIAKLLSGSDIFIAVPESDATSVSLLEAMAAGVIPVVSNIDSKTYVIKDGINGYALEVGLTPRSPITPLGIAEKIVEAIENKKQNKFIIKTNRMLVEKFYLFEKNMEQLEKIYEDVSLRDK